MDVDTLKKAASGDPDAVRKLRSWLADLSGDEVQRLDELLKRPAKGEDARFWADLIELKDAINSNPAPSRATLEALEERARKLGSCELVQVAGLRSYRHRLLGELDAAQQALHDAWLLAPNCRDAHEDPNLNPCVLDLYRRQGKLDGAFGRLEEGLIKVEAAIDGYRRFGGTGHDLDGDGVASSVYARAEIRFELGDFTAAAADFCNCLDLFPNAGKVWSRVQQDLAAALSHTDREGRKRAYALLRGQRLSMRSRGHCVEKGAFLWINGQLAFSLGERNALKKLCDALDCFASLGMPHHYIGVAHDIARSKFPRGDLIKAFLDQIKPTATRLISDRRHTELFNEIYDLVSRCPTPSTGSHLDMALRRLRDLVSTEASLPPCLLTVTR